MNKSSSDRWIMIRSVLIVSVHYNLKHEYLLVSLIVVNHGEWYLLYHLCLLSAGSSALSACPAAVESVSSQSFPASICTRADDKVCVTVMEI